MERKIEPSNYQLNQLKEYKDKICILCGRAYPETILNIQAHIEKNADFVCVETEKCHQVRQRELYLLRHANKRSN